jgi:hypothetical protein
MDRGRATIQYGSISCPPGLRQYGRQRYRQDTGLWRDHVFDRHGPVLLEQGLWQHGRRAAAGHWQLEIVTCKRRSGWAGYTAVTGRGPRGEHRGPQGTPAVMGRTYSGCACIRVLDSPGVIRLSGGPRTRRQGRKRFRALYCLCTAYASLHTESRRRKTEHTSAHPENCLVS